MSDYTEVIWTDNETSRDLIWRAYIGFKENFENYVMYERTYGCRHKVYAGGLWRYAISLYEEIRPFVYKFSLDDRDVVERILDDGLLFEDDNLRFLMRFFNSFLFVSGMKNIVFSKDTRSGLKKVADMYKLDKK